MGTNVKINSTDIILEIIFCLISCIYGRTAVKLLSLNRSVKYNKAPKSRQDVVDTACRLGSIFALTYIHTQTHTHTDTLFRSWSLTFAEIKRFLTTDSKVPAGKSPRLTPLHISDSGFTLTNNLTFQLPQFHPHKLHSCMSIVLLFHLLCALLCIFSPHWPPTSPGNTVNTKSSAHLALFVFHRPTAV